MSQSFPATVAAIAIFSLLTVAVPEPIMLDVLGAGMALLGFEMICGRA
ncbi:MAG: hypothetical protein M3N26_00710 [Pseudomonadota bacterium]|nr:hypothetical protein [Pseudomonadota bacterium]